MRLKRLYVAIALSLLPGAAAAQAARWQTYVVAETRAKVDIPVTVFSDDAGKPDAGYGRRFLTSDGRANLTVQSIPNVANDSPAVFLAKRNPPSGHRLQKSDLPVFCSVEHPQWKDLV